MEKKKENTAETTSWERKGGKEFDLVGGGDR